MSVSNVLELFFKGEGGKRPLVCLLSICNRYAVSYHTAFQDRMVCQFVVCGLGRKMVFGILPTDSLQ